jgi:hypothetical protein
MERHRTPPNPLRTCLLAAVLFAACAASAAAQPPPRRDPVRPSGTANMDLTRPDSRATGGVVPGQPCPAPGQPCPPRPRCTIQDNNSGQVLPPDAHGDVLFQVLTELEFCPQNALTFRDLLEQKGLTLSPAMVANRGFNNPLPAGSFSFFESVTGDFQGQTLEPGDFFFGHFTAASLDSVALTNILSPQQAGTPDNLLLESVIWDPRKGYFNFYEIRGTGEGGIWFYRGDSLDILKDITNLDRNYSPDQIQFGTIALGGPRLRCSGCHMNGGPIMKELKLPHDSWWRDVRPLNLGAMRIAPELQPILDAVVGADRFSHWVKAGDAKLLASPRYWSLRGSRSFQEQLRPLFCEQEVNLESDLAPFVSAETSIHATTGLFLDPRLLPDGPEYVVIDKALYTNALVAFDSLFFDYQAGGPRPTDSIDGDHAFEAPVKSHSDMELVAKMVADGTLTDELVADVLAVDMTRPMFSETRCSLLRLVPESAGEDWLAQLEAALERSHLPGARELLANLRDPERSAVAHRARARRIADRIQQNASLQSAVTGYVRLLAQQRIAVFQDQISQHPQGQIFEPDFRLIFPTLQRLMKDQQEIAYGGVPGQFWLDPDSGLVELSP